MSAVAQNTGTVVHLHTVGNTALAANVDDEARIAPRRRMLKSGKVAYSDRHVTIDCTGARHVRHRCAVAGIEGSVTAPDTFELLIPLDGLEANCQVVWRSGADLGVRFLAAPRIVAAKRAAGHQRADADQGADAAPQAAARRAGLRPHASRNLEPATRRCHARLHGLS